VVLREGGRGFCRITRVESDRDDRARVILVEDLKSINVRHISEKNKKSLETVSTHSFSCLEFPGVSLNKSKATSFLP